MSINNLAIKAFLKNKQYYIYILIICFIIQAYYIDLFKLLDEKFIAVGGDLSYELVPIKIAFDGNLLGFTKDLVWPNGYATWAYPTMGLGTTTLAWLIGIFPFELSIFFTYFFIAIIGNLINAISLFWAIKDQFVNKVIPFSISTLLGISSLIFYRIGHMPVIWFYFIIIILGVWFKFNQKKISLFKVFTIILLAGIFSPFWWNLVAIFLALFIITIYLINFRLNIENVKFWAIIIFSTLISYFPTLVLYLRHSELVGPSGRNPWQSNVFGGRLSDVLVSSPFLNQKFNLLKKLNEAVSPEARITQFGIVIGLGVIISLIYLASSLIGQFNFIPKNFNLLIFALFFFFILGGAGKFTSICIIFDESNITCQILVKNNNFYRNNWISFIF